MQLDEQHILHTAKRKLKHGQVQTLVLADDSPYHPVDRQIVEIYISQFAIAYTDDCLSNISEESLEKRNKLPMPIAYALIQKHVRAQRYPQALKVIQSHIDRKTAEKLYVLTYNTAKINHILNNLKTSVFYLQNLLKEMPFFAHAIYDLAFLYSKFFNRNGQALGILQRHLTGVLKDNHLVHSAFIALSNDAKSTPTEVSKTLANRNFSLVNYFNLALLFKKKKDNERALDLFEELHARLLQREEKYLQKANPTDIKLIILTKINLIQLRELKGDKVTATKIAYFLKKKYSTHLDPQTIQKLQPYIQLANLKTFQLQTLKPQQKDSKQPALSQLNLTIPRLKVSQNLKTSMCTQQRQQPNIKNSYSTRRLKYLLSKQKQIESFFRNLSIKKSDCPLNIKMSIKNSIEKAKKEINQYTLKQDLNQEDYIRFEEEFEQKKKQKLIQFNETEVYQSIQHILAELQNLSKNRNNAKTGLPITSLINQKIGHVFSQRSPKATKVNSFMVTKRDLIKKCSNFKKQKVTMNLCLQKKQETEITERKCEQSKKESEQNIEEFKIVVKNQFQDILPEVHQSEVSKNQSEANFKQQEIQPNKQSQKKLVLASQTPEEQAKEPSQNITVEANQINKSSDQSEIQIKLIQAKPNQEQKSIKSIQSVEMQRQTSSKIAQSNQILPADNTKVSIKCVQQQPKKQGQAITIQQEKVISCKQNKPVSKKQSKPTSNKQSKAASKQSIAVSSKQNKPASSKQNKAVSRKQDKQMSLKSDKLMSSKQNNATRSQQEKIASSKQQKAISSKQQKAMSCKQQKAISSKQQKVVSDKTVKSKAQSKNIIAEPAQPQTKSIKQLQKDKSQNQIPQQTIKAEQTPAEMTLPKTSSQEYIQMPSTANAPFARLNTMNLSENEQEQHIQLEVAQPHTPSQGSILQQKTQQSLKNEQKPITSQKSKSASQNIFAVDNVVESHRSSTSIIPNQEEMPLPSQNNISRSQKNDEVSESKSKRSMLTSEQDNKSQPKLEYEYNIKQPDSGKANAPQVQSQPIPYDPMASTFQLTGFEKMLLGKFEEKNTAANPSDTLLNFFSSNIKSISAQPCPQIQQKLMEAVQLQNAGNLQQAYKILTGLYKQFKGQAQKQAILLAIGRLFEMQNKFEEAERTYFKCTKFNSAEAFLRLGSLLLRLDRVQAGIQNLQKADCIKRFDVEIQNKLVYGYSLRQQTMTKALNLAHNILKKNPSSIQTLIMTAGILQKQGLIKQAIEIVTQIDKVQSTQYIKHYLGILYLQDSNLTESYNAFKAALNIKPDYIPSLIEVASIISDISSKQAIELLNKVLEKDPTNRKALARLGKIYQSVQGDFQSAMRTYQTALDSQENYESYIKLGDCLAKRESYIEALLNYKQALNLKKSSAGYAKLALMYEMKAEYSKAIEGYQSALAIMKDEPPGQNSLDKKRDYLMSIGKLSHKIGQFDAAIASFEEIIEGQESAQLYKLLGESYFGKREHEVALQYFEKANNFAKGQDVEILQNLAICLDQLEEYLASKAIYEKILRKEPNNIRCLNNLANILLITGQTNEAFQTFEIMLQKAPKNLQKRLKIADIYAQVGDWSKVEYHLLQCYRLKQHDTRVLQKLVTLYKEKRDMRMVAKYEKKLALRTNHRSKPKQ